MNRRTLFQTPLSISLFLFLRARKEERILVSWPQRKKERKKENKAMDDEK